MNQQALQFPNPLDGQWQNPTQFNLAAPLYDWLVDPTSLTARLIKHSKTFSVEVVGQKIALCSAKEANQDIGEGSEVLVREVILYCDDQPHVFARSLLPLTSLTGAQQQLAHLGNQSLGQVLFNDPDLVRKSLEISSFALNSCVAKLAQSLALTVNEPLWGRRSTFVLNNKPLMVAEVFLPGALAYKMEKTPC